MWVRLTTIKMDPANVEAARALYNSEQVSGVIRAQEGYRFHHLLESVDNPGESLSITGWDSKANSDAYEQSGTYATLVGQFEEFFTGSPELRSYEIHK